MSIVPCSPLNQYMLHSRVQLTLFGLCAMFSINSIYGLRRTYLKLEYLQIIKQTRLLI